MQFPSFIEIHLIHIGPCHVDLTNQAAIALINLLDLGFLFGLE